MLYARTDSHDIGRRQTLLDHSRNVAEIAGLLGRQVGLERMAYLMGYTHDAGKAGEDFQEYIFEPEEQQRRHKIIHSRAGALAICKAAKLDSLSALDKCTEVDADKYPNRYARVLAAEILCLAITGHHAGLRDVTIGLSGGLSLAEYILKEGPDRKADEQALALFYKEVLSEDEIQELFRKATVELRNVLRRNENRLTAAQKKALDSVVQGEEENNKEEESERTKKRRIRKAQYATQSLLAEYLESCLIEADRYDAQCFNEHAEPNLDKYERVGDWGAMMPALEKHLSLLESESKIGQARKKLSDNCAESASRLDAGIYKCWAPTGFGKTLSSLRFSLNQANRLNKKKVFYIIPYTSIIDQTAQIFKAILGEDYILEHHCNVQFDDTTTDEQLSEHENLVQSWDKPIVLTTMVQFLNTAFTMKNTNLRRMHALTNSVIIFDEIQSLPEHCTYSFFQFCTFLYTVCNCTIVLCSATQPETRDNRLKYRLLASDDIGGLTEADAEEMRRTKIVHILHEDPEENHRIRELKTEELANIVLEKLSAPDGENRTALIVHNTKNAALNTFCAICNKVDPTQYRVHLLTTNFCAKHRKKILATLREELQGDCTQKVIIVSTQLIEAGVDISVDVAFRSLAGLDNVIQTAGRCRRNSNGEKKYPVYVFESADERKPLAKLPTIQKAQGFYRDTVVKLLGEASEDKLSIEADRSEDLPLMSGAAIKKYYEVKNTSNVYIKNYLGYTLKPGQERFDNIADAMCSKGERDCRFWRHIKRSEPHRNATLPLITTPYRTISDEFHVIEEGNQKTVFVPYDDTARAAIAVVQNDGAGSKERKAALQTLQQYSVSFFLKEGEALPKEFEEINGLYFAQESAYDEVIGLSYTKQYKSKEE